MESREQLSGMRDSHEGMGEPMGRMADRAAEQAGRVTDLAAARAKSFVSSAREQAEQAAGYVQDAVQQTRDKVAEYAEGGFERVRDDVVQYTRQQPVSALLMAAGIGLLIGWITAAGGRR
jgi:ElaB/YqjD/DUF883 family membrane-anchored ribosome-binding protein